MAVKKTELYSSLWASCDALRGGMDASQYEDYILTLLFMKYVTDKYKGQCYFSSKTKKTHTQNTKKAVKCFIYPKHLTAFIMYEIFKNCFYKATLIPL